MDLARACLRHIEDKKGENPVLLDLVAEKTYADYLLIASGGSDRHVTALAQAVVSGAAERGVRPIGVEGLESGRWALIDLGDVVVHIFHRPLRTRYDLEGLWYNAPRVSMASDERPGEGTGGGPVASGGPATAS